VKLKASWGAGFNRNPQFFYQKECDTGGTPPGDRFCAYLMQNTSTEFQRMNFQRAASCLMGQPKDTLAGPFRLRGGPADTFVEIQLREGDDSSLVFIARTVAH